MKCSEFYHYGVSKQNGAPGPGSGRYPLGSGKEPYQGLSDKEKNKISKEYKKYSLKSTKNQKKVGNKLYVNSYNEAAKYMNEGGIEKFNREQEKKYGSSFSDRAEYLSEYEMYFDNIFNKVYSENIINYLKTDKYYKMAEDIASKYLMAEWDPLAKDNENFMKELYDLAEKVDNKKI